MRCFEQIEQRKGIGYGTAQTKRAAGFYAHSPLLAMVKI
jgi:hypothetical protein